MITRQYSKFQDIVEEIKTKIRAGDGGPLQSASYAYKCPVTCLVCGNVDKEWAEKLGTILLRNGVDLEQFVADIGPKDKPRFSLMDSKLNWMWGGSDCFDTAELLFHIARVLP